MSYSYDYAIIGGDMRQSYLVKELSAQSSVAYYALSTPPILGEQFSSLSAICEQSACIIAPIPLSKDGVSLNQSTYEETLPLQELLSHLQSGQLFFAGCIPKEFESAAKQKGVIVFDFMKNSSLAIFNSIATAEGAICEAIQHSPINLHGSVCAVLGYGKCGQTLAKFLQNFSTKLYIVDVKIEELAKAHLLTEHVGTMEDCERWIGNFDFIFNTIPSLVLSSDLLMNTKPDVTIIDIASAPGGVDFSAAQKMGISAFLCSGLPGKYAPASSASAIRKIIEKKEDNLCL
jgi:dipicolinate synthase subunit A